MPNRAVAAPFTQQDFARKARLELRKLQAGGECVQACALVSYDGLIVASVLPPGMDEDRFGAMCASLLALSSRAAKEAERGELRQIILDGEKGPVLLTRAGLAGVLAVAADPTHSLGKLIIDTRTVAAVLGGLVPIKASQ